MPTVSIIMNCYNGARYLCEAIDSIYAQTFKDWEIIFWDNASTDNSAEIAKSYDEKLRYFKGKETVPLYAARNFALKEARGKYIAFLDCDDMWLPQKIEKQVELFENDSRVGLIHTNVELLEINGSIDKMHNSQPSGMIFKQLLKHYCINIQTAMISRAALDSLEEWFDNSLHFAGDADLFLRIAHDWDIKYLPVVTAKYRVHGENRSLKFAESIPTELEYIIGKFSNLYKDFMKEYEMEITEIRIRAQKALFFSKWKTGKNLEARRLMRRHLSSMCLFVLLYLSSFLPYKVMSFTRKNILWHIIRLYRMIIPFSG